MFKTNKLKKGKGKIDWLITLVPVISILGLAGLFFVVPNESNEILSKVRYIFGDTFGVYFLIIGLGFFILSLYLSFSKYGDIVLGGPNEKPKYSFPVWGSMMFTCGLAADILFYSFSEWAMYATSDHVKSLGDMQDWSGVFGLFHWSFIPWSFYLVMAVAFGFMMHVKNKNKNKTRQRFSEACRPLFGDKVDGILGRIIDIFAVFALLAGTATTFSVATPLISTIITSIFKINIDETILTMIILAITCVIYTISSLHGFKGMSILSRICMICFFFLMLFVLIFGGNARYIIETGFESVGRMIQNFIGLSTYVDPNRTTNFAQDWTIYYWAYWMVWCISAPFFIAKISRGRTLRQTIIGGYGFGVGSTLLSFIIFGNYGLGIQVAGKADFLAQYEKDGDLYGLIISIIETLPCAPFVLAVLLITMILFFATSFDSIAYMTSLYSYKKIKSNESPNKKIRILWCLLLITLPMALIFSESSMSNIQTVSIITAFPLGIIMTFIVIGLMKGLKQYVAHKNTKKAEISQDLDVAHKNTEKAEISQDLEE